MGKRDALKYHFMAHHWVHNSATALDALAARKAKGSMREVMAERDQGHPEPDSMSGPRGGRSPASGSSTSARGSPLRSARACWASSVPT